MLRHSRIAALACAAAVAWACDRAPTEAPISHTPVSADARYFAHDLGALTPTDSSVAYAIGDTGVITGFSQVATGGTHAVLWDANGTILDLGVFSPGGHASGLAINIHSTVVGYSDTLSIPFSATLPFVWRPGNVMQSLPRLPAGLGGMATGVNNADTIVGVSDSLNGRRYAVRWDAGGVTNLGTLPGHANSFAAAINNTGTIVGWSEDLAFQHQAVRWTFFGIAALANPAGSSYTEATAVNDAGEIVGMSFDGLEVHAVYWNAAGVVRDLGTLPGGTFSRASGINRHGDIVGTSTDATGNPRAVLWKRGSFRIEDLGTLPGRNNALAHGINRRGAIVGQSGGTFPPALTHATCWGPRRGC